MKLKNKNNFILVGATVAILIICGGTSVEAAFQSRPDAASKNGYSADQIFTKIREMETDGAVLGMDATIDTTTSLDVSTNKNGVDVHMAKNTEWGAVAILADSTYGSVTSGSMNYSAEKTNGSATTGNATGIYQMADGTGGYEYVAGIYKNTYSSDTTKIVNASPRYRDDYNDFKLYTSVAKYGDATIETKNWKSSSYRPFVSSSYPHLLRSYDSLFGCGYSRDGSAWDSECTSRAVLVCAPGL